MSKDDTSGEGMPMGPDAQALLRAVRTSRHDDPPPNAKARVRGALTLALAGGAAASVGGASATASANAGAGLATKALGGLAASSGTSSTAAASAAVGSAAAGSAAVGTTAVGSAAVGAGLFGGLAMKVAIAAIAVSAVGGIALVQGTSEAVREPVETSEVAEISSAPHTEPAIEPVHASLEPGEPMVLPVAPEPSIPVLDLPEPPPEAPTPVARARGERTESPEAALEAPSHEEAPASSTLMAEMALLSPARAAISRGDATAARRLVRDYRARFPSGALAEEFAAIEVEGLCIESDPTAVAARHRFESAHPTSAYASRIGRACD